MSLFAHRIKNTFPMLQVKNLKRTNYKRCRKMPYSNAKLYLKTNLFTWVLIEWTVLFLGFPEDFLLRL